MRTKCGLWWTCPMIGKPLRINGSSRGRQTLILVLLSTKLDLSKRVFDKFKMLTTMRFSHSYRCLKSVRIMLAIATFCEIWQKDVKTAFLNGFIKERVVYDVTRRFCQS